LLTLASIYRARSRTKAQIRDVTEACAREAARLRTATGRAAAISATDPIVAAYASAASDPVVFTSSPSDLAALAGHATARSPSPRYSGNPAHPSCRERSANSLT
jgi:hypothetical protein